MAERILSWIAGFMGASAHEKAEDVMRKRGIVFGQIREGSRESSKQPPCQETGRGSRSWSRTSAEHEALHQLVTSAFALSIPLSTDFSQSIGFSWSASPPTTCGLSA